MAEYDPFEASGNDRQICERLVFEATRLRSDSCLQVVSDSTGVPVRDLLNFKSGGRIEDRFVPVLYGHYYDNRKPEDVLLGMDDGD
jgi:hypothetical protein